ncbi:Alkyl hydroperoxide reductase subunit C [Nonomuraea coxensis DSM 45129]|uniref:Peroxiredoxin n=1 Tax=Nonomuraea coxensis DSM 45129 TaxID=1122611 RepID=A0ABX8TRR0_9ACTN|nr:peroxiredoxin [Nonomuraea coxensis]QYC38160.1 Alkyl hydroperoxide reductase subunit C [Nonomuraea coxensis DSM 45129]
MTIDAAAPAGLPLIGDRAPDFAAETTHGPVRLADYAGRWLVLFSHPADFTPVCTTEFVAFAELAGEFADRNVALLGNSIDSVHSHLAWTRAISDKLGVTIPFPIVADLDTKVSRAYGMLHPNTSATAAVRAVFVIDPEATVRAILYYPMNAGRMVPEILRLVDALQTSDRDGVACPANWRPGDDVLLPAPRTQAELDARLADERVKLADWYLASVPGTV